MNDDDLHTAWVKRAMELAHEVALAYSEMSSDGENDHMGEWHAARNTLREHLLDQPASMALTEPELRAGIALQRNEIERLSAQSESLARTVMSDMVNQREPLTTAQINALVGEVYRSNGHLQPTPVFIVRAIERAHGIGPTALDEQIEAAEFAEAERQIQTGGF